MPEDELRPQPLSEAGTACTTTRPHNPALLAVLMVVVAAVVLAVHWPVLSSKALSWDDEQYLLENELVQNPSWESAKRFLTEVLRPSTVRGYYQPLAMISLMLDSAMGGAVDNLTPFRRTSLLSHVANTLLVIVLLYLLFRNPFAAAIVGLLYGVHPLTIESIPWLAERKTLLAAFFSLWCLIFYVRFSRTGKMKAYFVCVVLFLLALISKPTSTPLPLLMLVLDYWPLRRFSQKAIVEKVPFLVISGVSAIITFVSQRNTAEVLMPSQYGPIRIPLMICHNIIFYLYKFVRPMKLSAYYPFPSPFTPTNPVVLTTLIGTAVLIVALMVSLRWTRALAGAWLFFFIGVFPTLGVIGFHPVIAADRHVYLPMIGFLLPVAAFLAWIVRDSRSRVSGAHVSIATVIVLLAAAEIVASRRYLVNWRDTVTHYEYMLSLTPNHAILHNNLALALADLEKTEQAIEHYNKSIELKPNSPEVHNNLGNALCKIGDFNEAIRHYEEAVGLRPSLAPAHYNLARAFAQTGNIDGAITEYREAIYIKPDYPDALSNLGYALAEKKRFDEAVEYYRRAIALKPDDIITRGRLGLALASLGRDEEAIEEFLIVLKARPDDVEMHFNVGYLLQRQGNIPQAIKHYEKALQLDPDFTKARRQLDAVLEQQKTLQ
jgi:tetratricopeptide (TPR) repeat protein